MTSSVTEIEPLLASSMRVLRNQTTLQDLIAAYPSLKEKSLASPLSLTELERRVFLDLPDPEMESANISAATSLSRAELIEKAITDRGSLTDSEVLILKDRFWTSPTQEENSRITDGFMDLSEEAGDEFFDAKALAYLENKEEAFNVGIHEFWGREKAVRNYQLNDVLNAALPYAPEWIKQLYKEGKQQWGFVCFYDAAAQTIDAERLEEFQFALACTSVQWLKRYHQRQVEYMTFNAPATAFAHTATSMQTEDRSGGITFQDVGSQFRNAFREILEDPEKYQRREDVTSTTEYTGDLEDGIAGSGFLTNTFLVFDPVCIDLVVESGYFYDNMRVLAFEAEFPVPGRTYVEGYQGYTWVRLDQLVYYFYELRIKNELGMDKIWEAAKKSQNSAFVSMDPEEALNWSRSNHQTTFTSDSILGKRRYIIREAQKS
ncbi:uncharacterized protein EAE97_000154 [Botrytis byssoidea]|uniref:Uncharacterized protein n=1 Tax=Botrytis byssoidea TaxID=139641 RepID=A0A9P5IX38_9HELO|nr:uncharacterized protein EAE97_000154 [Botrytis byssoidea]KAF7954895.1 hypothetical protein EAE97_000154 [Botrytis byssoidea]